MRNPAEDGVVTSQAEPPAPKRRSAARRNRNKKSQGLTPGSESGRGVAPEGWKHLCQEEKSCFPPAAASCAAGARGAKIQASCPVPRLLGGAGRARASSFLTTSPECELGAWGTWGQGSPAPSSALLLPQPCSTWLPSITLLNPAAAWPQAAVQALCSGYQLAAARRADKGQFRARRSLRAPAPSTRLCGARG